MKSILLLLKGLLFWLFFFLFFRASFFLYNHNLFSTIPFSEIAQSFLFAWRLDLATSCYLLLFSFITSIPSLVSNHPIFKKIHFATGFLLVLICIIACLGNVLLYKEWQSLLGSRALAFLRYPKEIFASLGKGYVLLSVFGIGLLQLFFSFIWKRFLVVPDDGINAHWLFKVSYLIVVPLLLFIGARGGAQLIPINESAVYFSPHTAVNHAAVNPLWYLGNSIFNPLDQQNKYAFMNDQEANTLVDSLYAKDDQECLQILKTTKPNIVFLILESHSANVIQSLGDKLNTSPQLDSLSKEGILFTNIYGSGSRTDQGLVSILSAFPAQPDKSIIKYTAKVQQLPSLYKDLNSIGYASSFFYGGEIEFANMAAYLRQAGINKMSDKSNYDKAQINSKWGAHDEFVLSKQLLDLENEKEPFISVLLTLSNHEPFEIPGKMKSEAMDEPSKFRHAAAYTDSCIGNYFRAAKKTEWYKNTLFILVADHGHRLPLESDLNLPESKHIPLIILGGALKDSLKGTRIETIGNQEDIAATLLFQLGLDYTKYKWSKNLLSKNTASFGFYCNQNVLGWITKKDTIAYSFVEKKVINTHTYEQGNVRTAKAYLQKVMDDFLNK